MRSSSRFALAWLVFGAAALAGCHGQVATDDPGEPGGNPGGTAGAGGAGADPMMMPGKPPTMVSLAACEKPLAERLQPARLLRLTRSEYTNSVKLIFGDYRPQSGLPVDGKTQVGRFISNAEGSVTDQALSQYQVIAEELSGLMTATAGRLTGLLGTCTQQTDACARALIQTKGRLAFRRPLAPAEVDDYMNKVYLPAKAVGAFAGGVRAIVETLLQSPNFLYRAEIGVPDPSAGADIRRLEGFELASKLAFTLWGAPPDDALLAAAEGGRLATPQQIEAEARRLLAHENAKPMLHSFHEQVFELDHSVTSVKMGAPFKYYEENVKATGLQLQETALFVDDVVWSGNGNIDSLLTARYSFINPALAIVYGLPAPPSGLMTKVDVSAQPRAGILTQASYLAGHAGVNESSVVQRGLTVRRQLLCLPLSPPPPGVDMDFTIDRTRAPACMGCHTRIDFIGQTMENFNAVGAYRTTIGVAAKPVDAHGQLLDVNGDVKVHGAVELAQQVVAAPEYRACMTTQWFRFAAGRDDVATDECDAARLQQTLQQKSGDVRELIVALALQDGFRYVKEEAIQCQ